MWRSIRTGDWLTRDRLNGYPLMFLAFAALAIIGMLALSNDRLGPDNRPLGTDFSQVWVAGKAALAGRPQQPFDIVQHVAEQHKEFGPESAVYGWHYPPFFLAPAALLAHLPYLTALLVWQLSTLALYLAAIFALTRGGGLETGRVLIAALAFPAALINLGHGQNGFLTAALLGGGFYLLDRRPLLAGAAFGLLAYKPQFALALPLALLAGRHWRTIGAAAVTVLAMTLTSVLAFGAESWRAFFANLAFTREAVIEQGATGFEKIQSVFAAVRLMGGDVPAAYAFQSLTTLAALAALYWLWRSGADARIKAAGAIGATLLSTPYSLDYDMMALAPALALLVAHGLEKGFQPFEKSLLAFAYAAPLLARPLAALTPIPIGVLAILLIFASTIRLGKARAEARLAATAA